VPSVIQNVKKNENIRLTVRSRSNTSKSQLNSNPIIYFRCSTCGKETPLFKFSFFSIFKSNFVHVVQIIKSWAGQITISKTMAMLRMDNRSKSRQTIGKIFARLRHLASLKLDAAKIKLGGDGCVVKEKTIKIRKANKSRAWNLKWMRIKY
jgi:hypothetical protein